MKTGNVTNSRCSAKQTAVNNDVVIDAKCWSFECGCLLHRLHCWRMSWVLVCNWQWLNENVARQTYYISVGRAYCTWRQFSMHRLSRGYWRWLVQYRAV